MVGVTLSFKLFCVKSKEFFPAAKLSHQGYDDAFNGRFSIWQKTDKTKK